VSARAAQLLPSLTVTTWETHDCSARDFDVLYLQAQGGVAGAAAATQRVGAALPTMRGREFYGICYDPDDDFRACVAVKEGDEAASFGLHR
jgi:hypothetical protein